MFNSIFGAMGQAALTGQGIYSTGAQGAQGMQNAYGNSALAQQQLANYYNQAQQQRTARWMIDGEVCYSVKDFAKKLYPEDEAQQMMLILKFGDI